MRMQTLVIGLALCLIPLKACQSPPKVSSSVPIAEGAAASPTTLSAPENSSDLTWAEAKERSKRLANIRYALSVDVTKGSENFYGQARIEFDLKAANKPLRLDFHDGMVRRLRLNGKDWSVRSARKKFWLELPGAGLREGHNQIEVDYLQAYSHQGQGLHRFTDPMDGRVFLYSQFEAFDANRFMPCFDQPDLRAQLVLTVEAPASWTVISTAPAASIQASGHGHRSWRFEETPRLATYLFSLHAGPFQIWHDQYNKITLRLLARPSLASHVNVAEWFRITKQGFQFFESYFAYDYPFKKCDQLIVPEFASGAMENVAAVTFSERYVPRGSTTISDRRRIANLILHEMAYMWFGNIVTMKWWNDLWLNESFASFMAALAEAEATEFKEAWQVFFSRDKRSAYWEDSLSSTHPIAADIQSVKEAFANFDGITYGKGAATLKQLRAFVSPPVFQKGLRRYIAQNAMSNTELKDLIASLQAETPLDLDLWSERWLRQRGPDQVTAEWSCTGKRLSQIHLHTTASPDVRFRPQTLNVALFSGQEGRQGAPTTVRAHLMGPEQVLTGSWPCPVFVYPNFGDEAFAHVKLDAVSLQYAKEHLSQLGDPLLRTMVWHDLWNMVRNLELPLSDYVSLVQKHFPPEQDLVLLKLITSIISNPRSAESDILSSWPNNEKSGELRRRFVGRMEQEYLRRFRAAVPGSDGQRFWFDSYVELAQSPEALRQLALWAHQDKAGPRFPLDLDRQWALVRQLNRFHHAGAQALLADLRERDHSDRGAREAMIAEAIQPDPSIKRKWLDILKKPSTTLAWTSTEEVLHHLFPEEQKSLVEPFEREIYGFLDRNATNENELLVEGVADGLNPLHCEARASSRFKRWLGDNERFVATVRKALTVHFEEDERCQRIRAHSGF